MSVAPLLSLALAGQLLAATVGVTSPWSEVHQVAGPADMAQQQQPVRFDATRFDSLTALNLRALLDSVAELGLPTAPLINRALEGAARRASGAKIMQVVRAHAAALAQARDILGTGTPVDELDAGATALRTDGVDARAVAAVRASYPAGKATIALTVLTDMVKRGVPGPAARDAVTTLSKTPAADDALRGLQLTVAKNAVRGPGMAVDALNRYLRGTVSGGSPTSAPATPDRKSIRPPSP